MEELTTGTVVHTIPLTHKRKTHQGYLMDIKLNEGIILVGKNRHEQLVHVKASVAHIHDGSRNDCIKWVCQDKKGA